MPLNPDTIDLCLYRTPIREMTSKELRNWLDQRFDPFNDDQPVGAVITCVKISENTWSVAGPGVPE